MTETFNCIILGAAGRDFHDFQTFFRSRPQFRVRAFTATQIPFIETRTFPKSLAGPGYDEDIPIYSEEKLPELIDEFDVDFVFLAYSDLAYADVMHKASLVQACGASFALLGPKHTQLQPDKPLVAVTGVRTGVGKSPLTQWLAGRMSSAERRVGVIRHPMPYGNLEAQSVQRFDTPEDLDRSHCTIEEREEYQPYVEKGLSIYAGVDYAKILEKAQQECDVLFWDGGNNDVPFFRADLSIAVCDALRAGHEIAYYPGETNFRCADILVINKVDAARLEDVHLIREHIRQFNPEAAVVESALDIAVDDPSQVAGKTVLVVEDGPTITHGGMGYGAGLLAARKYGAKETIDPRPFAVGTIGDALRKFPHIQSVLPALGYSDAQVHELQETIDAAGAELVLDASPASIGRLIDVDVPIVRVRYRIHQLSGPPLDEAVSAFLDGFKKR